MTIEPREEPPKGIVCPKCGCRHFWVTHTEPLRDGRIRRRRECRHCGKRVTTYEVPNGYHGPEEDLGS